MTSPWIGVSAALGSAAAWAAGSILYKKLGEKVSAPAMNLMKSVLSLMVLLAALAVAGFRPMGSGVFVALVFSGLLGIALGDTLFFLALQKLSAHILVLLCALGQVLTVLIAVALLGERPSWSGWIGIGLIIGGVSLVLHETSSRESGRFSALGVAQGLSAVLCMSLAVVLAKSALASVSAIEATVIRMLGGVIGLTLWGGVTGEARIWMAPFKDLALMREALVAVFVASLGGFWLFHVALKHIDVSTANTLNSTEPLFVLPLAAVFLKEKVTGRAVVGAIISVAGIVILSGGSL